MSLFLGCPVWAYKGWVGSFFPKGTKSSDYLREYAGRLNTVEGNTTFYATPSSDTIARWVEETPPGFQFCPKIPKSISHAGAVSEHIPAALGFVQAMQGLGSRLGPMFLQLPPGYSPKMLADLSRFLDAWPPDVTLAVEVRHMQWFDAPHHEALSKLLSEHEVGRVVIDTRPIRSLQNDSILEGSVYLRLLQARQRKPDLPVIPELTAGFVFLRFIGHPQLGQDLPVIEEWAGHLADWLRMGMQVYVFCHCPDERLDPWLCREFHRLTAARLADRGATSELLPPLPWDASDADEGIQGRLL
jgi:uncharacterized protein YecE (DUF72 family)